MDKLSGLVPEFYYDLIGRVTPGAVLCSALVWRVHQDVPLSKLDGAVALPLGLMVSYLLGYLLDAISGMTVGRIADLVFKRLATRLPVWQVDVWSHIHGATDERHRAKLTKMMAERTLARSLVTLALGMWTFNLVPVSRLGLSASAALVSVLGACWFRAEYNARRPILSRG